MLNLFALFKSHVDGLGLNVLARASCSGISTAYA